MNMLAFIFAANTQHVDVIGPILKPLVPFLVLAAIIKVATSFIPKKRQHSQHTKAHNKSPEIRHHIKSFTAPILKEREKEEILLALREWDASVTPQQRASHVDNLRQHHN
jgi:hypothetical protein